ncbi:MAG: PIN domain-containing protein [Thermoleophilia bacterium]|nr:PIN domain-containing protein [Thermoleophilia bacterium]
MSACAESLNPLAIPVCRTDPCFLDTSALYAVFDRAQSRSAAAVAAWEELVRSEAPLVTSNYVLWELTALLQRRLSLEGLAALQEFVLPWVEVAWVDPHLHDLASGVLLSARRRDLSLVDCASFALMRARGLRRAFTLDRHFAEQGFACLPDVLRLD